MKKIFQAPGQALRRACASLWAAYREQTRFVYLSVFWFLGSLILALVGVLSGPWLVTKLASDNKVDLQTMGELLGGTLGVAVAFAGAWVAFKIASFANEALEVQELREAQTTANQALEQSIGKILAIQLAFEKLLRRVRAWWQEEEGKREGRKTMAAEHRGRVAESARQLSDALKELLANPLALSVLLALQQSKPRGAKTDELLHDLSQLPRWCEPAALMHDLGNSFRERHDSPYDMALRLQHYESLSRRNRELDEWDKEFALMLEELNAEKRQIKELSFLCHLTHEYKELQSQEVREPRWLALLRYFLYSPEEADDALRRIFSTIYKSSGTLKLVLGSGSAKAFRNSGQINDHLTSQLLRDSRRITQRLEQICNNPRALKQVVEATFQARDLGNWGLKDALRAAHELRDQLIRSGGLERESYERYLCQYAGQDYETWEAQRGTLDRDKMKAKIRRATYANLVITPTVRLLCDEFAETPPFEAYGAIVEACRQSWLAGLAGGGVIFLADHAMRRQRMARAQGKLLRKLHKAEETRLHEAEETSDPAVPRDGQQHEQVLRVGAETLCELAEEANALPLLLTTDLPKRALVDVEAFMDDLRDRFEAKIIEDALPEATAQVRTEICQMIERERLYPRAARLAAFALRRERCLVDAWPEHFEGGASTETTAERFDRWSREFFFAQIDQKVTTEALCVFYLCELEMLGVDARLQGFHECGFDIRCESIPGVPEMVAKQVLIRFNKQQDQDHEQWSRDLCWSVPPPPLEHSGVWLEEEQSFMMALLCSMLGYRNDEPDMPWARNFSKRTALGDNSHFLRVDLLELRLLGHWWRTFFASTSEAPCGPNPKSSAELK